jgi:hypothetical protein
MKFIKYQLRFLKREGNGVNNAVNSNIGLIKHENVHVKCVYIETILSADIFPPKL